ncbi:MAG: GYF domain-containing protein [Polyangiales bacterium]
MKIVCQSCSATYRIADEKVQGKKVFKIKCKKCGEDILVRGTDLPGEAPDEATRMMDAAGAEPIWHAVVNGDQQGPFTVDQVRELIAQGAVDGETYVWREGFDNWLPLHSVDELAGAFGPAPSIAPSAEMPAAGGDLFASMVPPPEEPERPSHVQPSAAAAAPVDNGLFAAMDAPRPAAQPAAAQPAAQPARAEPAKARAKTGGGDLFAAEAIQQESSRPLFSEEPAAASAGHDAGGESMTGQRNENSVLFSLASLQQLSTTRETKSAGEASGDASGLIDINKLAGAIGNAPANGSKKSSVDDILTVGASSGLGSPLAAPVLAPVAVPTAPVAAAPVEPARPAAGNKNMTAAIIGAAVIVMGGIVGAAYMVTSRNEPANTRAPWPRPPRSPRRPAPSRGGPDAHRGPDARARRRA